MCLFRCSTAEVIVIDFGALSKLWQLKNQVVKELIIKMLDFLQPISRGIEEVCKDLEINGLRAFRVAHARE